MITAGPVAADYVTMPSVTHYPLQANAIVFAYNLPTLLSGGNILALRPTTLCRIFRGNITRWNDVDIQADNPAMTGLATAAADEPIIIPTVSVQTATHYWFSTYCGKVRHHQPKRKPLRQATSIACSQVASLKVCLCPSPPLSRFLCLRLWPD